MYKILFYTWESMPGHAGESQKTAFGSQFFPFTIWVWRTELRSSGMPFTSLVILIATGFPPPLLTCTFYFVHSKYYVWIFCLHLSMYEYVWVHLPQVTCGGQHFLPQSYETQGLHPGHQAWRYVPSLTDPSQQPTYDQYSEK